MKSAAEKYYAFQTTERASRTADSMGKRFARMASWYGSRLGQYLPTNLDSKMLDIPCGSGNLLYFLSKAGYSDFSGVDFDPNQVRLAQSLALPAIEADAFEFLEDKPNYYDCILSLDFLEHLSRDEAVCFLELCHRSLKPGGALIVRTACAEGFFGAHDRYNDLTHEWAMTSNVLKTLLEMVQFTSVAILDERPQPYNLVNKLRLLIYYPAKWATSLWLVALGLSPPSIWSRSMWGVARHP